MSKVTVPLRRSIVRKLTPKLYVDWVNLSGPDSLKLERPMISFLKNRFGDKPLVGCEVGVREGINSARILKALNIKRLYLVDPYTPYYEPLIPETQILTYQNKVKTDAHNFLKTYADKTVWVTKTSDNAVNDITEPLDFCYLDGDHSYSQVKRDLENYGNLITQNGVLGGHDFSTEYMGLCKAIIEYKLSHNNWFSLQGKFWDWWLIKK